MLRIGQLKVTFQNSLDVSQDILKRKASRILNIPVTDIEQIEVVKQSH